MTDRAEIERLAKALGAKVLYDKEGRIDAVHHQGREWSLIGFAEYARPKAKMSFQNGQAKAQAYLNQKMEKVGILNAYTVHIRFKDISGISSQIGVSSDKLLTYDRVSPYTAAQKFLEANYPGSKLLSVGK